MWSYELTISETANGIGVYQVLRILNEYSILRVTGMLSREFYFIFIPI